MMHKFQILHPKLLVASLFFMLLSSCLPDIQEVKIDRTGYKIAAPIINSKTDLDNLFDKLGHSDNIVLYPDNTLGIVYEGDVIEVLGKDLFRAFGNLFFKITNRKTTINIPIPDQEISQAHISGDSMIFLFQGNGKDTINYSLTMPTMRSPKGDTLRVEVTCENKNVRVTRSVQGYTFGFNPGNSFPVELEAKDKDGHEIQDVGTAWLAYDTLYFSYIEGVFGQDSFLLPKDTIIIDVFDKLEEGGVFFNDPRVSVSIENSFGFPVSARIKELSVVNKQNLRVPLSSPLIDKGIFLQYPMMDEVGVSKTSVFAFDKNNSNIFEAFNANPTKLIYEFTGVGNPDTSMPVLGFATDSSFLKIKVKVELPVNGWVDRFVFSEKTDWSWNPGDLSAIDSIAIKTILLNGLPVDLGVQVYLLRDSNIIDSIFAPKLWQVQGAPIDANGYASGLTENRNTIQAGAPLIRHMQEADQAVYKVKISTTDAPDRTSIIRKSDIIDLKLGVKVGL